MTSVFLEGRSDSNPQPSDLDSLTFIRIINPAKNGGPNLFRIYCKVNEEELKIKTSSLE